MCECVCPQGFLPSVNAVLDGVVGGILSVDDVIWLSVKKPKTEITCVFVASFQLPWAGKD